MFIIEKPGPFKNGNRASKSVFVGTNNLVQDTQINQLTQVSCCLADYSKIVPNEKQFPIICRHWPIYPNQKSDTGRGGMKKQKAPICRVALVHSSKLAKLKRFAYWLSSLGCWAESRAFPTQIWRAS
jgi:hypothetical protein